MFLLLLWDHKQHKFVVGNQCIGPTFTDQAVNNQLSLAGETEKSSWIISNQLPIYTR